MAARMLILDVSSRGLAVTAWINGVIVVQDAAVERQSRSVRATGWAVPGQNTLEVRVDPLRRTVPSQPLVTVILRDAAPGPGDSTDQVLVELHWDPALQQLVSRGGATPSVMVFPFNPPASWGWTRADMVAQPAAQDLPAIRALLERLHAALAARDIPQLLLLQSVQLGEQAVAAGEPARAFDSAYAAFLEGRMAPPDWAVQPIDWGQLRIVTLAGGRVHLITRADRTPPIMATSSDGVFGMEPYLARLQGRWAIVR